MNKQNHRNNILNQRYGSQKKPNNIIWNEVVQLQLNHRSHRRYLEDPLPDGTIETMVAAAQSASASSNLHQWSVIAITDKNLKAELTDLSHFNSTGQGNPYIKQAPVLLLWVADASRINTIATHEGGSGEVHEYLDSFLMASIDTAIAAQNAAIAAESMGLGIVYIGGMRNRAKEVAEILNLPRFSYVVFGMVVGWPDLSVNGRLRPRPTQNVVLHYNQYDKEKSFQELDTYEAAFKEFREDLGMKDKTYKEAVCFSSNDYHTMDGRQNLREMVQSKGFKLL